MEIQNIYDNLFLDDSIEFKYLGFSNDKDKYKFLKMIDNAVNLIKSKLRDLYVIEKNRYLNTIKYTDNYHIS